MKWPAHTVSTRSLLTYGLQVIVAVIFLWAAVGQFAGKPGVSSVFDDFDRGVWLRNIVAVTEVVGAIALLTRSASVYGAMVLSVLMLLASVLATGQYSNSAWFWSSLYTGRIPVAPNVLLAACLLIAWLRRDQLARFSDAVTRT